MFRQRLSLGSLHHTVLSILFTAIIVKSYGSRDESNALRHSMYANGVT